MAATLELARSSYDELAWQRAFDAYASLGDLGAEDLERYAQSACMLGLMPEYFGIRDRQYSAYADAGDDDNAARIATFVAIQHIVTGEIGAGTGWLARAERHATQTPEGSLGRSYACMAAAFGALQTGQPDRAIALSDEGARGGRRHGDRDLEALGLHQAGLFLLQGGRVAQGLPRLDEAMLVLKSGELSPLVTGIIYCNVVTGCWSVNELTRAQEWTAAMTGWCEAQPELANFDDECRVRRAELKVLHGRWSEAVDELSGMRHQGIDGASWAQGAYLRGELARFQGRHDEAEAAYREAARLGLEPQPGLALLRLAQGSTQAAAAMVKRALVDAEGAGRRVDLLTAAAEVFLTVDDVAAARDVVEELGALAEQHASPLAEAHAAHALALLELHTNRHAAALPALRSALKTWLQIPAPFFEARTRALLATACRGLGDPDSAEREQSLAEDLLRDLGGVLPTRPAASILTPRELEVLRLVARGATNRAIAETLVLSERTVDRHVSNILAKLGVPSRAAATAFAIERQLV